MVQFGIPTRECGQDTQHEDRKSTRLNSSHSQISYAVFCLKKKKHRAVVNVNDILKSHFRAAVQSTAVPLTRRPPRSPARPPSSVPHPSPAPQAEDHSPALS